MVLTPTPRAITHEVSPRAVALVDRMQDQSGVDDAAGWNSVDGVPETLRGILDEIGRVYVPALLANDQAVKAGEKCWEIDGAPWVQQTFPYQAKCLRWIREQNQTLAAGDKMRVDAMLAGTGCAAIIG